MKVNKQEFFKTLDKRLSGVSQNEIQKSILYYDEIISDRMEDGMSEEEAIDALGDIDIIIRDIMVEMSISSLVKTKIKESKQSSNGFSMFLLFAILGFPIWFPLLMSFISVIITLYIFCWVIIFSLFTVVFALVLSGFVGFFVGIVRCFTFSFPVGLGLMGVSMVALSLGALLCVPVFYASKSLVKYTAVAVDFLIKKVKTLFISKNKKAV